MTNRKKKTQNRKTALRELTTVAFAEDMELAKQYKQMLNENEIPVVIKSQADSAPNFPGIAVMVPEDHLDEAHVLIESESSNETFYDMVYKDDQYEEPDEDVFDDDFE